MNTGTPLLISSLNHELSIALPADSTEEKAREKLYHFINNLINTDFEKLVLILYRIDVSETRLKQLLQDFPASDAAVVIGNLIIERTLQKIKTRQEFSQRANDISEDEKW